MSKRPRPRRPEPPTGTGVPIGDKPPAYIVKLTPTAERAYVDLSIRVQTAEDRGDTNTANHTALRMIDEVIDVIIPHDPINKRHALAGVFSNIFRYSKGRIRICWIASSEKLEAHVLFISDTPRKDGDRRDPYEVFGKLVTSGQFDNVFDQLGVRRPPKRATIQYALQ